MNLVLAAAVRNIKNAAVLDMLTVYRTLEGLDNAEQGLVISEAAEIIRRGGLVAFPTETVYGLGADALNPAAVKKIYEAKGRPSDNPLIVHITENMLEPLVRGVPEYAKKLMLAFWPGALTLILNKTALVPDETTGGLDSVALRFPSDKTAAELIRLAGPIAAPSSNRSGRPSPTNAAHVRDDLDGRIDMILDGGSCELGLESTIIDATGEVPLLLRPGSVTSEMIEAVCGRLDIDKSVTQKHGEHERPRSPGQKYRHYAPKARLIVVKGKPLAVARKINALAGEQGVIRTGVLTVEDAKNNYDNADIVLTLGSRSEPTELAAAFYSALREFDAQDAGIIYAEAFDESGIGLALMDRLTKASGYTVIDA